MALDRDFRVKNRNESDVISAKNLLDLASADIFQITITLSRPYDN